MTRKQIWKAAKIIATHPTQVKELMDGVVKKLKGLKSGEANFSELKDTINTLLRMLKSYRKGDYHAFAPKTIMMVVFALVYFITPTDAIPDFVPALGFTDDLSIIFLIYSKIKGDMQAFLEWENSVVG